MADAEVARTVRVIYAGRREGSGEKILYWYVEEGGTESFGGFAKPLARATVIGAVIEVDELTNGQYRTGTAKVVGSAEVPTETRAGWQLADELIAAKKAQAAALRRIEREVGRPLDDLIAPLQKALDSLNWSQRAAAMAIIISRLR
jgi:hypothetical protein